MLLLVALIPLTLTILPSVLAIGIELDVNKKTEVEVKSDLENTGANSQPFVYVVQIEDSTGIAQFLSLTEGNLGANNQQTVGASWSPENDGLYKVKTFLLTGLEKPEFLTSLIRQTKIMGMDKHWRFARALPIASWGLLPK